MCLKQAFSIFLLPPHLQVGQNRLFADVALCHKKGENMHNQLERLTERLEKIELLLAQVLLRKDGKKDDDKLLSIKEAAAYLHLSVSRMYRLIYEGKLKPIQRRKNSKILFSTQELDNYLAEDYKRLPELLINNGRKNTVNNKKQQIWL